jgi:hypothetical protein
VPWLGSQLINQTSTRWSRYNRWCQRWPWVYST